MKIDTAKPGRGEPEILHASLDPQQPHRERKPHDGEQRQERVRIRALVDQARLHEQPREAVARRSGTSCRRTRSCPPRTRPGPTRRTAARRPPRPRRTASPHAARRVADAAAGRRARGTAARRARTASAARQRRARLPPRSSRRRATNANASTVQSTLGRVRRPEPRRAHRERARRDDRAEHEPPDERPGEQQRGREPAERRQEHEEPVVGPRLAEAPTTPRR